MRNRSQLIKTLTMMVIVALLSRNVAIAQAPPAGSSLDTITVEAKRKHDDLQREVNEFVDTALIHHDALSNAKWVVPICPLVAGLNRDQGEFVLTRLSTIATNAGARVDSQKCYPNLLVIVTNEPERLLAKWNQSHPSMFADRDGLGELKRFMHSKRPVRAWYNAEFVSGFFNAPLGMAEISAGGTTAPINRHALGTRIQYDSVRAIITAIVIVDRNQLADLNFGQIFDYVAMLALAEINQDKEHGNAPSVLNLFANRDRAPTNGMSPWDEAFLKALYETRQEDHSQLSEMATTMTKSLEAQ